MAATHRGMHKCDRRRGIAYSNHTTPDFCQSYVGVSEKGVCSPSGNVNGANDNKPVYEIACPPSFSREIHLKLETMERGLADFGPVDNRATPTLAWRGT